MRDRKLETVAKEVFLSIPPDVRTGVFIDVFTPCDWHHAARCMVDYAGILDDPREPFAPACDMPVICTTTVTEKTVISDVRPLAYLPDEAFVYMLVVDYPATGRTPPRRRTIEQTYRTCDPLPELPEPTDPIHPAYAVDRIPCGQAGVRERTDRSTIVPPKMIPSTMTPGLIRAHHHPSTALHHSAEAHPLAAEQPAAGDKKIRH